MGELTDALCTRGTCQRFASLWLSLLCTSVWLGCSAPGAAGPSAKNPTLAKPRGQATLAKPAPAPTVVSKPPQPVDSDAAAPPVRTVSPADSAWASDAFYLLARRHGKHIDDVMHCKEGVEPTLRRWNAIDQWGKIVGKVEGVDAGTHHFNLLRGTRGARIYTTAEQDFPSARWEPSQTEAKDAKRWLSVELPASLPTFFKSASVPAREFVVGFAKTGFVIGMRRPDGWRRVARAGVVEPNAAVVQTTFELRAILDINGDGQPEVIYHAEEAPHEVILQSANGGTSWFDVAENEDVCP